MRLLWQVIDNVAYWWCYMVSNLNAISLLTGKEVSLDLYRSFLQEMKESWHDPKSGKLFTSWPKYTIPRRKKNMSDTIVVSQIELFSATFRVNIIRWIPMVVSIATGDERAIDREDWILTDISFDDTVKNGHAIVLKWLKFYDSRRDQKTYSFTRQYISNVKWLFKSRIVLVFKRK